KAEPIDDVVEPPFEQLEERLAGDAPLAVGDLEIPAELVFEHTVDALDLLLLAQLEAVAHQLRLAPLALLTRRQVALLDRAFRGVAALPFQEELHPLAPAQPADRTDVTCHSLVVLLRLSRFASGFRLPASDYGFHSVPLLLEAGSRKLVAEGGAQFTRRSPL